MTQTTKEIRSSIQRALRNTWQYIGADVAECAGKSPIPRAEVVDVCIDQLRNQGEWEQLTPEAKEYWEKLSFEDLTALGIEGFPYELYE